MDYTYLAIDMLNQHLEEIINVEDTAMESNVFEVDELDHSFIPVSHRALFAEYLTVMTHLYNKDVPKDLPSGRSFLYEPIEIWI